MCMNHEMVCDQIRQIVESLPDSPHFVVCRPSRFGYHFGLNKLMIKIADEFNVRCIPLLSPMSEWVTIIPNCDISYDHESLIDFIGEAKSVTGKYEIKDPIVIGDKSILESLRYFKPSDMEWI